MLENEDLPFWELITPSKAEAEFEAEASVAALLSSFPDYP